MKIRLDYVTNSSSSSFVIMYKSIPEIDKEILEQYPLIKNYIKMLEKLFIANDENINTVEELDEFFIDRYGWGDQTIEGLLNEDEYLKENYKKYKQKLEDGYNIAIKDIDYNDERTSELLYSLHDGINFIVEGE